MIIGLILTVLILGGAVYGFHKYNSRIPNQFEYEILLKESFPESHPDYYWFHWYVNKVPKYGKGRTTIQDSRECSSRSSKDAYDKALTEAHTWLKKEIDKQKQVAAGKEKRPVERTFKLTAEEAHKWEPNAYSGRVI